MLTKDVIVVRSAEVGFVDLERTLVAALAVGPSAVVLEQSDGHGTHAPFTAAFDAVDTYLRTWSGTPLFMHLRDPAQERAFQAHPLSQRVTTWPSLDNAVAAAQLPPMERLSLTLDPEMSAPRRARELVDHALASWDPERPATDLKLVVTELVTNAVIHAQTALTVTLTRHRWGPAIRVAVRDGSNEQPVHEARADTSAPGRRGLLIVSKLSRGWGGVSVNGGKIVWAALDEPR